MRHAALAALLLAASTATAVANPGGSTGPGDAAPPTATPAAAAATPAQYPDPPQTEPVPAEAPKPAPAPPAEPPKPQFAPIVDAVRERLTDRRLPAGSDERAAIIQTFERLNGPLWTTPDGLSARAKAVIAELGRADEYGLPPAELVPSKLAANGPFANPQAAADAEVQLSLAALKYARYARGGRIPEPTKQLATYIDRAPQLLPPEQVLSTLASATDADAALRDFNPRHPQFEALRQAYLEAIGKRMAAASSPAAAEPETLPEGPTLTPGMRHPNVAVARRILKVATPAVDGQPGDPTLYDSTMVAAVRAFQQERDLSPADGLLGRRTRNAMNGTSDAGSTKASKPSARDLLVNMEQWRWMPADLGDKHIMVNIPEFSVRVVKSGAVVHEERVVTGQITKQTPLFSDRMKTLVLRPDWILPPSIKVKDAIPSLIRGSGMFYANGLKIKKGSKPVDPRSVDWFKANPDHYTFYQPPGDRNALGQVKFLFPNKHAVYLHDTPTKHLFNQTMRAHSSGCVRVRNPIRLAEIILEQDKGWTADYVRDLIETGPDENRVTLDKPLAIHLAYFTVTADANGKLVSHKDIYGHARRISLALDGRFDEIDVPPDHLAPIEDREFESHLIAAYQARDREAQRQQLKSDPVGNFFQQLFGGGY